jgi:hypothetical protein
VTIQRINGGRGHWYKIDGTKADGVTTLIGNGLPKPALTRWAAKSVAEHVADNLDAVAGMAPMGRDAIVDALKGVPWASARRAAVKGTEVHALAEKLSHGELVEVPEHLEGHVESCVAFLDDWQIRPVRTETVVGHRRWRYCGSFDGVWSLPDGRRVIGDYKTSGSGVYPEVALQMAAYRHAEVYLDENNREKPIADLGITDGVVVWLRSDGYDVYPVDTSEPVFKDFLHVAWVARTKDRMDNWLGGSLPAPAATLDTALETA